MRDHAEDPSAGAKAGAGGRKPCVNNDRSTVSRRDCPSHGRETATVKAEPGQSCGGAQSGKPGKTHPDGGTVETAIGSDMQRTVRPQMPRQIEAIAGYTEGGQQEASRKCGPRQAIRHKLERDIAAHANDKNRTLGHPL